MKLTSENAIAGQKVACVNAVGLDTLLTNGKQYTIYAYFPTLNVVTLTEVQRDGSHPMFYIGRFQLATSTTPDTTKPETNPVKSTITVLTRATTQKRHAVRDSLGRFTKATTRKTTARRTSATTSATTKKTPANTPVSLRPGALYAVKRKRRTSIAHLRSTKPVGNYYVFTEHGKPFFAKKSQIRLATDAEVQTYLSESVKA